MAKKKKLSVDLKKLQRLSKSIDYEFNDVALLQEALTHRSFHAKNNERLEYLGDSILGFLIAECLYRMFPEATEGQLSRSRSKLVKGDTLATIARNLQLGEYLLLGPGELKSGGFRRASTLADAFEALVGAIYVDGGLQQTRIFVDSQFENLLNAIDLAESLKDPKTILQELLQSKKLALPVYTIIETSGSDHEQFFTVQCEVQGLDEVCVGEGTSRRKAEQAAAKKALKKVQSK
ncbi:ribonuclease III [Kaarinaea lacus]